MARATETKLGTLHGIVADAMTQELEMAMREELPISPQMFSAVSKFLKDNEITCQIDESEQASHLNDEFTKYREERRAARKQSVSSIPMVEEG